MQYGEIQSSTGDENKSKVSTIKLRHGLPFFEEEVFKERVQIMKVTDLDLIIEDMHVAHALAEQYGAWLEKARDGRLYAIKYWVEAKRS